MTTKALPAPLTPAASDLQDFPFMPLHVSRLRDSDLAAEEEPEACWYAVLLWAASWHQLPAGSLPSNEVVLCKLLGLGRDLKTFRKHRGGALRGWIECADGRLYHPVVAEQVSDAWRAKLEQRWRTECARIKKHNQRHGTDIQSPALADFVGGDVPRDSDDVSRGTGGECPSGKSIQGTETGTETGTGKLKTDDEARAGEDDWSTIKGLSQQLDAVAQAAGMSLMPSDRRWAAELERLKGWIGKGFDMQTEIRPAIDRTLVKLIPGDTVGSLKLIERELFGAKAKARVTAPPAAAPQPLGFEKDGEDGRLVEWRTAAAVTIGAASYRNLLDGAALRTDGEELIITVADPIVEMQLSQNHLFRLEGLAKRIAGCRLVRIAVRANAA